MVMMIEEGMTTQEKDHTSLHGPSDAVKQKGQTVRMIAEMRNRHV